MLLRESHWQITTSALLGKVITQCWFELFSKAGFGGYCMTKKILKRLTFFGHSCERKALWSNSDVNLISQAKMIFQVQITNLIPLII